MPTTATAPTDFWGQILHQLKRIETEKPDTFDAVRAILLDSVYTAVTQDINRNWVRVFDADHAFFAGSGGDDTLLDALWEAGWQLAWHEASYHFAMTHPRNGESLVYIEGDLKRDDNTGRGQQP